MSQRCDHVIECIEGWWKIANLLIALCVGNVEKDQCIGSIFGNQYQFVLMYIPTMASYQMNRFSVSNTYASRSTTSRLTASGLLLAMGPNSKFSSKSGSNPELPGCTVFHHMKTYTTAAGPVLPPKTRHLSLTTLATI
jgi:hypothetical protein